MDRQLKESQLILWTPLEGKLQAELLKSIQELVLYSIFFSGL